ncbi:GNAT family N-acetyltransferase [Pontibacillus marinus]|uniref:Acetyltransferase n=1 Tax=Pontibacillus marinus BH030004 = DSM 16465 TaxID=1385511 RepID=A0A0A5FU50_9BACI|nr:GNAT family protein [Pontibacillus marinus]KGX84311.1 acetyltransferase [Pontibacillus marinus BH030004 = DSM 16465]
MLKGNLVELRPVKEDDLRNIHKWNNNEEVTRLGSGTNFAYQINNPHEALKTYYQKNLSEHNLLDHGQVFSVYTSATNEHIGKCDYRDLNFITRTATIGLLIGEKEYWGRGYGQDIIQTLVNHLFNDLNLKRIQLDTWSGNNQAIRLYEKCGFQVEGRLRQNEFVNGTYYDTVLMGLLQEDVQKS